MYLVSALGIPTANAGMLPKDLPALSLQTSRRARSLLTHPARHDSYFASHRR